MIKYSGFRCSILFMVAERMPGKWFLEKGPCACLTHYESSRLRTHYDRSGYLTSLSGSLTDGYEFQAAVMVYISPDVHSFNLRSSPVISTDQLRLLRHQQTKSCTRQDEYPSIDADCGRPRRCLPPSYRRDLNSGKIKKNGCLTKVHLQHSSDVHINDF